MIGTRPLGWLFNLFGRQPQGRPYNLIEIVQPTIDTAIDWPIFVEQIVDTNAFIAGANQLQYFNGAKTNGATVPNGNPTKHRIYLGGFWSNDQALTYQPAALGTFECRLQLNNLASGHTLTFMDMQAGTGFGVSDQVPFLGKQAAFQGRFNSGTLAQCGGFGNVYVPPGGSLVLSWSNAVISNTTVKLLYVERDQNSPLPFLT